MRTRSAIAIAAFVLSTSASGAQIYQCQGPGGEITLSDMPCDQGYGGGQGRQVGSMTYDTAPTGVGGYSARDANRELYNEVRERSYERRAIKRRAYRDHRRDTLSYADRTRIRELEMEKGQLQDELRRADNYGIGSYGKARAIGGQIRGLDRQIEQIRAR